MRSKRATRNSRKGFYPSGGRSGLSMAKLNKRRSTKSRSTKKRSTKRSSSKRRSLKTGGYIRSSSRLFSGK